MGARQLFLDVMNYQLVDHLPVWDLEGVSEQSVRKWIAHEGFPIGSTFGNMVQFDGTRATISLLDQPPIPSFIPGTIASDGHYVITRDVFGNIVKHEKSGMVTPEHYMYLGGALRSKDDWQDMKKRYIADDARRFPLWWSDEYFQSLNAAGGVVSVEMTFGPGRGTKNYYMFGFDRFMEIVVEEPALLEDIFDFWSEYMIRQINMFIGKIKIDYFMFMEDGMAYKNSTLISPSLFNRLYRPYMQRVVDLLKKNGVRIIGYYTSGNIEPFIPSLLDMGINMLAPLECGAGLDAVKLRNKYGRDLLMIGNIAKEAVMRGKTQIDAEIDYKVGRLIAKGGYVPALDDMITPDMTFENVLYFINKVKQYRL
jgi:uroporphyrinogen decarboxylase